MNSITPNEKGFISNEHGKIYYEYYGDKNSAITICFNSFLSSHESWHRFIPELVTKNDILIWDYLGQGLSSYNNINSLGDLEIHASFMLELIETLEIGHLNLNLLGISSGGYLAMDLAMKHPELFKKVILAGTLINFNYPVYYRLHSYINLLDHDMLDIFIKFMYSDLYSHNFIKSLSHRINNITETFLENFSNKKNEIKQFYTWKLNFLESVDKYIHKFKKAEIPFLYIEGQEDICSPNYVTCKKEAVLLKENIAYIADSGHYPLFEKPKDFFNMVNKFFQ